MKELERGRLDCGPSGLDLGHPPLNESAQASRLVRATSREWWGVQLMTIHKNDTSGGGRGGGTHTKRNYSRGDKCITNAVAVAKYRE